MSLRESGGLAVTGCLEGTNVVAVVVVVVAADNKVGYRITFGNTDNVVVVAAAVGVVVKTAQRN